MASRAAKITFRMTLALIILSILFYVGRPLYWKISATIHDIRHNKLTVSGGISEIVSEAQKLSGGWFHDESDSGIHDVSKARFLRQILMQFSLSLLFGLAVVDFLYFDRNV